MPRPACTEGIHGEYMPAALKQQRCVAQSTRIRLTLPVEHAATTVQEHDNGARRWTGRIGLPPPPVNKRNGPMRNLDVYPARGGQEAVPGLGRIARDDAERHVWHGLLVWHD